MKYSIYIILFMVGALLQGLGAAFGAVQQSNNVDDYIYAQKQENERNRKYNFMLAQKQNEWNIQQWERANEYNTPLNQMIRLKEGKLNPNLVYGNGAGQSVAAPNPQMTSGSPSTPFDMSILAERPTVGQIISTSLNNEYVRAQIDKVKAEARSEGYQGDILKSDAAFRDAVNQGNIELGNMQINGLKSDILKNDAEITEIRKRCVKLEAETNNLIAEYDKIRATIVNIDADTASKRLRDILDTKKVEAEIRKLASSISVDMATAKRITTLLSAELLGLEASAELTWSQIDNERLKGLEIVATTDSINYSLEQSRSFDDAERATGIYGEILSGLTPIASLIGLAMSGSSRPIPVKGFHK